MIVNIERETELSLYYLGSILLKILEEVKVILIEDLLQKVQNELDKKVHVDFLYYALDWLFILSLISIKEGKVYYEDKKIDSTKNKTF